MHPLQKSLHLRAGMASGIKHYQKVLPVKLKISSSNLGHVALQGNTLLIYLNKWFAYCQKLSINPTDYNVTHGIHFLTELFEADNLGYSVMNTR